MRVPAASVNELPAVSDKLPPLDTVNAPELVVSVPLSWRVSAAPMVTVPPDWLVTGVSM